MCLFQPEIVKCHTWVRHYNVGICFLWHHRRRAEICLWRANNFECQSRHLSPVDHIAQLRPVRDVGRQGRRPLPQSGSRWDSFFGSFYTGPREIESNIIFSFPQEKLISLREWVNHWTVTWANGEPQIARLPAPAFSVLTWLVQQTKLFLSSTETRALSIAKSADWCTRDTSAGSILGRESRNLSIITSFSSA